MLPTHKLKHDCQKKNTCKLCLLKQTVLNTHPQILNNYRGVCGQYDRNSPELQAARPCARFLRWICNTKCPYETEMGCTSDKQVILISDIIYTITLAILKKLKIIGNVNRISGTRLHQDLFEVHLQLIHWLDCAGKGPNYAIPTRYYEKKRSYSLPTTTINRVRTYYELEHKKRHKKLLSENSSCSPNIVDLIVEFTAYSTTPTPNYQIMSYLPLSNPIPPILQNIQGTQYFDKSAELANTGCDQLPTLMVNFLRPFFRRAQDKRAIDIFKRDYNTLSENINNRGRNQKALKNLALKTNAINLKAVLQVSFESSSIEIGLDRFLRIHNASSQNNNCLITALRNATKASKKTTAWQIRVAISRECPRAIQGGMSYISTAAIPTILHSLKQSNIRVIVIDTSSGDNEQGYQVQVFNRGATGGTVFIINTRNVHFGWGALNANQPFNIIFAGKLPLLRVLMELFTLIQASAHKGLVLRKKKRKNLQTQANSVPSLDQENENALSNLPAILK